VSLMCKRLHELVRRLPEVSWPFDLHQLPRNGIYFFCERGETWGHGGERPRIVRVGTHREGNFRSRIADHYVVNDRKMSFGKDKAAPKDRSIFRKNIGRALLCRDADPYAPLWEIDFTSRSKRETEGSRRDVDKENQIEREVTRILRERFTFRWIEVEGEERRMGSQGLEATLIGTLAACSKCRPSHAWLGRFSPKTEIVQSGLWLVQHLRAPGLTEESLAELATQFRSGRASAALG
jgi:hypothetical protein